MPEKIVAVTITSKDGVQFATLRMPEARANEYVKGKGKERLWGKPERWIEGSLLTDEEKAQATNQRDAVDDFDQPITEYFFPAEYSVQIEDVTAQVQAREQAKAKREKHRKDTEAKLKDMTFGQYRALNEQQRDRLNFEVLKAVFGLAVEDR